MVAKVKKEKSPVQLDIELCNDNPKCWRFAKKAPICINCPWQTKGRL